MLFEFTVRGACELGLVQLGRYCQPAVAPASAAGGRRLAVALVPCPVGHRRTRLPSWTSPGRCCSVRDRDSPSRILRCVGLSSKSLARRGMFSCRDTDAVWERREALRTNSAPNLRRAGSAQRLGALAGRPGSTWGGAHSERRAALHGVLDVARRAVGNEPDFGLSGSDPRVANGSVCRFLCPCLGVCYGCGLYVRNPWDSWKS